MKLCKTTGKRKYHNKDDALVAFSTMPLTMRVYLCPDCGFWHGATKYRKANAA